MVQDHCIRDAVLQLFHKPHGRQQVRIPLPGALQAGLRREPLQALAQLRGGLLGGQDHLVLLAAHVRQGLLPPVAGGRLRLPDVDAQGPRDPAEALADPHLRLVRFLAGMRGRLEGDAGKVREREALALGMHVVEVIEGAHALVGGGLVNADVVVYEACIQDLHARVLEFAEHRGTAGTQAEMRIHQETQLLLDCLCCLLSEPLVVEGQIKGTHGPRHEPVHGPYAARGLLLPSLQEELAQEPRVRGLNLQSHDVHDSHEERHAVVPAPVLQLGLAALHLLEEVLCGLPLVRAPGCKLKVELR
mmetsp:Transcript_32702/g.90282  ORF Transcript_32702/g.90282 Transcript_32702/m.90282 type:complete len:303 (-) Transcript_32702:1237-2145(-)